MKLKRLFVFLSLIITLIKANAQEVPVVISNCSINDNPMVFFISNDEVWDEPEEKLKADLKKNKIQFVGLYSDKYFAARSTPQKAAKELSPLIRKYRADWGNKEVVILGYGFGANVAPFIFNQLDDDVKKAVAKIILIRPSQTTDFMIHPKDKIASNDEVYAWNVAREILKITTVEVVCLKSQKDNSLFKPEQISDNIKVDTLNIGTNYCDYINLPMLITKK
mgnify:CR=1 FL=1